MWQQIAIYVGLQILSYLLAPKPKVNTPKPAGLGDIDVPVAEVGKTIPVLFGTRELKNINVLWYGNLKTIAIKKKGGKK
jgi:hypothetical protein